VAGLGGGVLLGYPIPGFPNVVAGAGTSLTFSGNTVTVHPLYELTGGVNYYLIVNYGAIRDLSGILSIYPAGVYDFTATDSVPPYVVRFSPGDDSTGVAPDALFGLGFNESVMAGAGNILVYQSDGTLAETIAATDTHQVVFTGGVVTITPYAVLTGNSAYYVNIDAGAIRDLSGNAYAGISDQTTFNFNTGPSDDYAANVSTTGVLMPDGPPAFGTIENKGDQDWFRLDAHQGTTYDVVVQSGRAPQAQPFLDSDHAIIYISNSQGVQIAPHYHYVGDGISFNAPSDGTIFIGVAGANATGTYGLTVTPDTTPPVFAGPYPDDNATNVSVNAFLKLTFNEEVVPGLGAILIYNNDGSLARSIDITDTNQVQFPSYGYGEVIVTPAVELAPSSSYYVNIQPGAIRDLSGNSFAGLSDHTSFNFSTAQDDYAGNASTTGVVLADQTPTVGSIEVAGDRDWLRLQVTAGSIYDVDLKSLSATEANAFTLYIYDASGTSLASTEADFAFNPHIRFTADSTGELYVGIACRYDASGNYSVAV
jgi:methionine-rich copper-binding protein CopC